MPGFNFPRPDGFDLSETVAFVTRFWAISASGDADGLDLAFALDDSWDPVGVHLSQRGAELRVEILANPENAEDSEIRRNLERILGLRLNIDCYRQIGERDLVVGQLQRDNPGVRPVSFPTAWEAGVWSILVQRTRRVQALAIKRRLSEAHGHAVVCPNGSIIHAFPGPAAIRALTEIQGLSLQRIEWLHGLADAALQGALDCSELAGLSQKDGSAALRAIPGIGHFSAELILARGAGNPDIFPMHEPILHGMMSRLYGVEDPKRQKEIAESWRPYRSWISYLLRIGG